MRIITSSMFVILSINVDISCVIGNNLTHESILNINNDIWFRLFGARPILSFQFFYGIFMLKYGSVSSVQWPRRKLERYLY